MPQVPHETIDVPDAEIGTDSILTLLYPYRSHSPDLPK